MRCATANHAAQGDDAIDAPGPRDLADCDRHFEGAGNPDDFYIGVSSTVLMQTVHGCLQQRLDDELVEARRDNGEPGRRARSGRLGLFLFCPSAGACRSVFDVFRYLEVES